MVTIPYICYLALVGLVAMLLLVRVVAEWRAQRVARRRFEPQRRLYAELARRLMTGEEEGHLPTEWVGREEEVADRLADLCSAVYGIDLDPLWRVVQRHRIDEWLLRAAERSRGYRRARLLKLLSEIPHAGWIAERSGRFMNDPQREVRFCSLLVQLAAHPDRMISLVGSFGEEFTALEVAEVLHLLRRGLLSVAYRPLLFAPSHNLRRVGLALVAQFAVEEAEDLLLQLVAEDEELAFRALAVLVRLRRPLTDRVVAAAVGALSADHRRRLLRSMAREGYGVDVLLRLSPKGEKSYCEKLVAMYKSSLLCG